MDIFRVLKYNPNRDETGRFSSASGSSGSSLASYAKRFDDPSVTAKSILSKFTPSDVAEISARISMAEKLPSSVEAHSKNGVYSKERRALHRKIISDILSQDAITAATPAKGTAPNFVVLGGRGGSGKSAFSNGTVNEFDSKKHLLLDSDVIKERLRPPYEKWNAATVHEESSHLFKLVTKMAMKRGLNVIQDATLKTLNMEGDLKAAVARGYTIEGHYMHLPRQKAAERAVQRYLSKGPKERGRLVPVDVILSNKDNESNFDHLKKYFTKWSTWDNQGGKDEGPKFITRGRRK